MKSIPGLLIAVLLGASCASSEDALAQSDTVISGGTTLVDHDARMTNIATNIQLLTPSGSAGQTYMVMFQACENALNSGASLLYTRPLEQWAGAYCSCDTLLTLESWMSDDSMKEQLRMVNLSDAVSANMLLSNHKIFQNDAHCRSMTERAAN